jgi:hypothetical protein
MAIDIVDFKTPKSSEKAISEYQLIKLLSSTFGKEALLMVTLSNVLDSFSQKISDMNIDLNKINNTKILGISADTFQIGVEAITGLCVSLGIGLSFFQNILDKEYQCTSPKLQVLHKVGNKIASTFVGMGQNANIMALQASTAASFFAQSKTLPNKVKLEKLKAFVAVYNKLIDTDTGANDSASQTMKSLTDSAKAIMQSSYDAETKKLYFK